MPMTKAVRLAFDTGKTPRGHIDHEWPKVYDFLSQSETPGRKK